LLIILAANDLNGLKNEHFFKMVDLNIKTGHIICTINERIGVQVFMGAQLENCTTMDMFAAPKIGLPKSNHLYA
jgi:hypothetical protein